MIGFLFKEFKTTTNDRVNLKGENKFVFDSNIPNDVLDELAWGTETILTSTAAASILIHVNGQNILRRGIISSLSFEPGKHVKDQLMI